QTPAAGPILRRTATGDNASGAPDSIRIELLRWSTDAERDQMVAAWDLPAAPAAGGDGAARGGGRGGHRAARARGGGAAAASAPAGDTAAAGDGAAAAGRGGARGGAGGGGGRGGGRGGRGAAPEPAVPQTPEASLAAALEKAPTLGYLWSSEAAGYAMHY